MSLQQMIYDLKQSYKVVQIGKEQAKNNSSLRAFHADHVKGVKREELSERAFVRSFGDKVKKVRYSGRSDFVGLLMVGRFQGIFVTADPSGERKVRLVDVDDGKIHVTKRYLRVQSHDSISNLQRGLLKYVR